MYILVRYNKFIPNTRKTTQKVFILICVRCVAAAGQRGRRKLIYDVFIPRYSWNTVKVGIKHQLISLSNMLDSPI
jgi:hypothetical protein